ncbi:S-layer protein [Methanothermococcus thermolithotrophicus]|uniref:S-layer protein n=1 Tax=Methanothermococcus thermolithotrophicus TaxID=2186 RepID=UPI00037CB4BF|nr:S-layer protein [Methanothermococcus thermolithotrophicus]
MGFIEKMTILVLTILCILPASYAIIGQDSFHIIVNEDNVDKNYAEMLMKNYYSNKEIEVEDGNKLKVKETIIYNVPTATDSFEIKDSKSKLFVVFEKDDNDNRIRYKKVEYEENLETSDIGKEIIFLGKAYTILDYDKNSMLLGNKVKDVIVKDKDPQFEYGGYKIILEAMNENGDELIINISKNNESIDHPKIREKNYYKIKNSTISIYYNGTEKSGKYYYFYFEVYDALKLEDGEKFDINNDFKVFLDDKNIILRYDNPEELPENFELLNYKVSVENIDENNSIVYFNVKSTNNYEVEMDEDTKYFGNNIFAIKKDDEIKLYKDGKQYSKIIDYQGSKILLDDDVLKTNSDLILIGGPVSNKLTKEIENYLKIPIDNENPGKNRGVIQLIDKPYNQKYKILVLAGSDRNGTKACVLALIDGIYKNQETLMVELEDGDKVKVVE